MIISFTPDPIVKVASSVPSVFKRARLFLNVPLYPVKSPQISIFPSGWSAILLIALELSIIPAPVAKLVSRLPLVLRRAILPLAISLYPVK